MSAPQIGDVYFIDGGYVRVTAVMNAQHQNGSWPVLEQHRFLCLIPDDLTPQPPPAPGITLTWRLARVGDYSVAMSDGTISRHPHPSSTCLWCIDTTPAPDVHVAHTAAQRAEFDHGFNDMHTIEEIFGND